MMLSMTSTDNPSFKLKYQKYKLKIKLWESEFTKSRGRIPSKDDIKAAPPDIKEAYRKYWTLKTFNLQRTILDPILLLEDDNSALTFDDVKAKDEHMSVCSRTFEVNNTDKNLWLTSQSADESHGSLNSTTETSMCYEPVNEDANQSKNEINVWGLHLNKNKSNTPIPEVMSVKTSSSSQLSKKLFGGSKFNLKRNPRKLSKCSGRSKSDLESSQESTIVQSSSNCHSSQETHPIKNSIDSKFSSPEDTLDFVLGPSLTPQSFKVSNSYERHSRNSVSIVDKALLEPQTLKIRELNNGWVKRNSLVMADIEHDSFSLCDSFSSPDIRKDEENSFTCPEKKSDIDDDLVSDSDTESSQKTLVFQACIKRKKTVDRTLENDSCDTTSEGRPKKMQKTVSPSPGLDENNTKECSTVVMSLQKTLLRKLSKATDNSFSTSKTITSNGEDSKKEEKNSKLKALERRMSSGTANDNFVKINIKKKIYARGKKNTSFSKYKKMMYRKKSNKDGDELCGKAVMKCFKCGDVGHYARNCLKVDQLLPADENDDDGPQFPTLAEAAIMKSKAEEGKHPWGARGAKKYSEELSQNEESSKELFTIEIEDSCRKVEIKPVYQLINGKTLIDTPREVYDVLRMFGHDNFRPGQEEAIMRILSGQSTLLMLSTGAGKSLCYQLPSYLYACKSECITLVISPLVSLMEDQLLGLPSFLKAACLHTGQTVKQRENVLEQIKKGGLHFLLVSPEAIVGCLGGRRGSTISFRNLLAHLPSIAFVCIDEAHCVSQWSHNFRPSYLMVCKILRENLGVKTILGLTATATRATASSVASHLEVPDGESGIIKGNPLPKNLILSASQDSFKDEALLNLMNGERFRDCGSLIIYCTRREECERLATFIRTRCRDAARPESNCRRNRISWNAECYHAGLSAARRKKVQQSFMNGTLRIVIATVAFGMGINKQNIRGIIHYNMPSNIESYVQEVGRAGRDGLTAHCHVLLNKDGGDLNELRRHIYSDSVDRHTIRKLLQKVFVPCNCDKKNSEEESSHETDVVGSKEGVLEEEDRPRGSSDADKGICSRHEVAISVDETVNSLDLPEENIATLLCYLELHPKRWIKVLNKVYIKCKVQCYHGPKQLREAAQRCPALAMAIALDLEKGVTYEKSNSIEFPVVDVASGMAWDSGLMKKYLKDLEWKKGVGGKWQRTGILVEFSEIGYHFEAPGNLQPSELDEALDSLHNRVSLQEEASLKQLNAILCALNLVSYKTCLDCADKMEENRSDALKNYINKYFKEEIEVDLIPPEPLSNEEQVRDDICHMVCSFRDQSFTGRAVARILHGISSPCFPAYIWGKTRFWRLHLSSDFRILCKVATDVILKLR